MTTNINAGMKIRIAVPLSSGDDTPIGKRPETRISTVEEVTDQGIIHETEGSVRVDRMGTDWEIYEEDRDASLCVVKMNAGPVLASFVRVAGQSAEMYSEQTTPPGLLVVPVAECGMMWDWLKGRTVGEVYKTLAVVFEPNKPEPPVRKKRGPKPRTPAPTGETAVLPAEPVTPPAPTVSAWDGRITFKARMRLWHAATELVTKLEGEADDLHVSDAVAELQDVISGMERL